jgi:hypothetical protein
MSRGDFAAQPKLQIAASRSVDQFPPDLAQTHQGL